MCLLHVCLSVLMMVFVRWSRQIQISLATMDREWNYHTVRSVHRLQKWCRWWAVVMGFSACQHMLRNTPASAMLGSLLSTSPIWWWRREGEMYLLRKVSKNLLFTFFLIKFHFTAILWQVYGKFQRRRGVWSVLVVYEVSSREKLVCKWVEITAIKSSLGMLKWTPSQEVYFLDV